MVEFKDLVGKLVTLHEVTDDGFTVCVDGLFHHFKIDDDFNIIPAQVSANVVDPAVETVLIVEPEPKVYDFIDSGNCSVLSIAVGDHACYSFDC